eukprot:m.56761 g.56761  ORF g.56761 m.56761 type:complete len:713 (-) comp15593_c0_seq2:442-2580(-)
MAASTTPGDATSTVSHHITKEDGSVTPNGAQIQAPDRLPVDSNPSGSDHGNPQNLCFRPDAFVEPGFSVELFLRDCRRRVAMTELQSDLSTYHGSLQNSMFNLINKDYAEFLSLSSNLAGLDRSIADITAPLDELHEEVTKIKTAMDNEIAELNGRISQRAHIREQKALLQRFLNISASVDKIEKLLANTGDDGNALSGGGGGDGDGDLIERVASEFNQLQFYVTQCQRAPYLDKIGPRIVAITTTLQTALEQRFRHGLQTNNADTLRQCIRTYAVIDKVSDVETMFSDLVVTPFVTSTITKQNLAAVGLQELYGQILAFARDKCDLVASLARELNISGCDFMVNAAWAEVAEALSRIPAIFASGIADDFHAHFTTTETFLNEFEALCRTQQSVEHLRAHPAYVAFRKRWSLPVYFQLRFQEIAGAFETLLAAPLERTSSATAAGWQFTLGPAMLELVLRCWSPDVFLPGLKHRFWKLTLQIFSRYATWLEAFDVEASAEHDVAIRLVDDTTSLKKALAETVVPATGLDAQLVATAVDAAGVQLDTSATAVRHRACTMLTQQCTAKLDACKGIPRQYRHTGRKVPDAASDHMQHVLAALLAFRREFGDVAGGDGTAQWIVPVLKAVTEAFATIADDVLTAVRKTEESLQRLKKLRKKDGDKDGMSDDNKIRLQLYLDAMEFQRQINQDFGIESRDIQNLERLVKLVSDAKPS